MVHGISGAVMQLSFLCLGSIVMWLICKIYLQNTEFKHDGASNSCATDGKFSRIELITCRSGFNTQYIYQLLHRTGSQLLQATHTMGEGCPLSDVE